MPSKTRKLRRFRVHARNSEMELQRQVINTKLDIALSHLLFKRDTYEAAQTVAFYDGDEMLLCTIDLGEIREDFLFLINRELKPLCEKYGYTCSARNYMKHLSEKHGDASDVHKHYRASETEIYIIWPEDKVGS